MIHLSVDPSKYKIFVNQNNSFDKIENIRFKEDFNQAQNDDIQKLFELARSFPIEYDFKNIFLSQIFANNLSEYRNKFRPMKLKEICQNTIEYKLIEYFENIKNDNINEKIRNNNNYKTDLKRF